MLRNAVNKFDGPSGQRRVGILRSFMLSCSPPMSALDGHNVELMAAIKQHYGDVTLQQVRRASPLKSVFTPSPRVAAKMARLGVTWT